jgi:predicted transcriptional regulator
MEATQDQAEPNIDLSVLTKHNEKVELVKAIELRSKGLTYTDIAKHFGCSKQAVQQRIANHLPYIDVVDEIRKSRIDILTAKGIELLLSLTVEDIKKMPPGSRAMSFGIIFDKERLLSGESTENVSIYQVEEKYKTKLLERQAMERKAGVEVSDDLIEDN